MDNFSSMPTFSPKEIADTLKSLVYGYSEVSLTEEERNGAYAFASELLGVSEDALAEYVNGGDENE